MCPRVRVVPLAVLSSLALVASAAATTWVVEPDGTGDAPTIQAAIDLADPGDTILLAPGVFTGAGNRGVAFAGEDLVVTSQGGPGSTTIDCEGVDRAFILVSGETSATEISGITIRNGNPTAGFRAGGAVACIGASPTVRNCVFDQNVGGGPIGGGGGALFYSQTSGVTIDDCVFTNNSVLTADGLGGAISLHFADATITRCTFENNSSPNTQFAGGGGLFAWFGTSVEVSECTFRDNSSRTGGGLCTVETHATTISNCQFIDNSAGGGGGGMCISGGTMNVSDCSFVGNSSLTGGGAQTGSNGLLLRCEFWDNTALDMGGGLFTSVSAPIVRQCTFANNSGNRGGGATVVSATVGFENCTFYHNTSANGGNLLVRRVDSPTHALLLNSIVSFAVGTAVTCMNGGTASVECSDVFGNSDGDWVGCLAGQQNLNDNFSADPLFCDADDDDLTIRSNSPCAPPGVTGCGLVGAHGVGCGPVSVSAASWASVKARYR